MRKNTKQSLYHPGGGGGLQQYWRLELWSYGHSLGLPTSVAALLVAVALINPRVNLNLPCTGISRTSLSFFSDSLMIIRVFLCLLVCSTFMPFVVPTVLEEDEVATCKQIDESGFFRLQKTSKNAYQIVAVVGYPACSHSLYHLPIKINK